MQGLGNTPGEIRVAHSSANMESEDVKKFLAEAGPPLFERYGVDLAYLFGSANSSRFRPLSDIDHEFWRRVKLGA